LKLPRHMDPVDFKMSWERNAKGQLPSLILGKHYDNNFSLF
jgi:hypothetical protein